MKTILVPIDLSATAVNVIDAAVVLAQGLQGSIVILHVVQPPVITSDYGISMENLEDLVAVSEKAANTKLAGLLERYGNLGVPMKTLQHVGTPVGIIMEESRKLEAAYIVMGSHGHSALYDLLVGTTTHGVLKHAKCPVLIVPPAAKHD